MHSWYYTLVFFLKVCAYRNCQQQWIQQTWAFSYPADNPALSQLSHILWLVATFQCNACCYTRVPTYLNFSACGCCCSVSTESWLEALLCNRRKGHYWNSFPTTGSVCRGRRIFSHRLCIPLWSGGSRRIRWVYLYLETEKKCRYSPIDRRDGSREGKMKMDWEKPCSLQGAGNPIGWFFLWFKNAFLERTHVSH